MATLRPLFAQLGAIERSDGSAQISHGRTAALAAVFGPGDVRAAKVRFSFQPFSVLVMYSL